MCSQVLKVDGHGLACDLWSIGIMAYALISGEFPWYSDSRDTCGQMIKYSALQFPQEVSAVFVVDTDPPHRQDMVSTSQ